MTHDEMIAVIQAHKEGKPIQRRFMFLLGDDWTDFNSTEFNFKGCEYRIKPESHYRPFRNAEEVIEAIKEHGDWLKNGEKYHRISTIGPNYVRFYALDMKFKDALGCLTFTDGTPFGVKEDFD